MSPDEAPSRWADSQLIGTIVRSVWQWQLAVAFGTVAVAVAVTLLDAAVFASIPFLAGLTLIAATTALSLVTPWARAPRWAIAVPLVDIVAIGLLAVADHLLGYLWVIPIAWVATYYTTVTIAAALALVVLLQLSRWVIPASDGAPTLEVLIVLLALGFLGVAMHQGARRTRAFRHLIRRQSRQLDRALARATMQESRAGGLFDALTTAIGRVDATGHIDLANAAYRALYSYAEDDDYRHPSRAIEYSGYRGAALPREATSLARAARGERVENELLWLYDADGNWRALSMSIRGRAGVAAADGEVSIIQLDDVTATELDRRIQRSAASAVSHELRNPLTVIIGHTDLLLDAAELSPGQRQHLTVIESAAERMLALTTTLLSTNRPVEAGDEFDLTAVTTAAIDAFAPAAGAADLDFTCEAAHPLPVAGDGFRMRQVVDNLVSNAIKYTPRGGAVRVATCADETGRGVLTVADTGIGIAAEDLDSVFLPYFRARSATDGGIAGTGLGMPIARAIVEENHGTLTLESGLGTGTLATVCLPLLHPPGGVR